MRRSTKRLVSPTYLTKHVMGLGTTISVQRRAYPQIMGLHLPRSCQDKAHTSLVSLRACPILALGSSRHLKPPMLGTNPPTQTSLGGYMLGSIRSFNILQDTLGATQPQTKLPLMQDDHRVYNQCHVHLSSECPCGMGYTTFISITFNAIDDFVVNKYIVVMPKVASVPIVTT